MARSSVHIIYWIHITNYILNKFSRGNAGDTCNPSLGPTNMCVNNFCSLIGVCWYTHRLDLWRLAGISTERFERFRESTRVWTSRLGRQESILCGMSRYHGGELLRRSLCISPYGIKVPPQHWQEETGLCIWGFLKYLRSYKRSTHNEAHNNVAEHIQAYMSKTLGNGRTLMFSFLQWRLERASRLLQRV